MKTPPLKLILPLLFLGLVMYACSHCPKSYKETDTIIRSRQEYIRAHPEGPFNNHILNGEVVKGMGLMEVLASWGLPNSRNCSESGAQEFWTYYATGEQTGDIREYVLIFKDQTLSRWKVTLSVAEGGYREQDPSKPVTLGKGEKDAGSDVLKKK
ncbi:MAG: hypothetical protein GTO51_03550 [Candidatus Latescibacteria bacterium]|nr:hypothetical protein [Candidatus Latescibacterota bacterium]NIM20914.1 hypothetical protein [Candidatus Latescibacterota bacterium]NIM65049.1 hypothetical protein [Candidatus Latescibacterota bacterium]NIO01564.1 hypothetical protein [Candidatus Latescibacterota bacterium]NIO28081.1 hypothetical protein [Candidatus Latescibacterota bacterium]